MISNEIITTNIDKKQNKTKNSAGANARKQRIIRSMLVSSCYVSRGMAVRKVSVSKSDLQAFKVIQGHWPLVPCHRPYTISY